jgi:hypothetical protein
MDYQLASALALAALPPSDDGAYYSRLGPNWSSFEFNISSLMSPGKGVLANFSTELSEAINGEDYMFGGPKRHRSDPPNQSCQYLAIPAFTATQVD